jgi:hypothetical protein
MMAHGKSICTIVRIRLNDPAHYKTMGMRRTLWSIIRPSQGSERDLSPPLIPSPRPSPPSPHCAPIKMSSGMPPPCCSDHHPSSADSLTLGENPSSTAQNQFLIGGLLDFLGGCGSKIENPETRIIYYPIILFQNMLAQIVHT